MGTLKQNGHLHIFLGEFDSKLDMTYVQRSFIEQIRDRDCWFENHMQQVQLGSKLQKYDV